MTVRTLVDLESRFSNTRHGNEAQDTRDFLMSVYPTEDTFTPTIDAVTTNPNLGSTAELTGLVVTAGPLVLVHFNIRMSGSGVDGGSGSWRLELPVAPSISYVRNSETNRGSVLGSFGFRDDSDVANNQQGLCYLRASVGGTSVVGFTFGPGTILSQGDPVAMADGDCLTGTLNYFQDIT